MAYEHIRELLTEHGLNQAELAALLGKTPAVITNLFNGERLLKSSEAQLLARKFNTTIEYILHGDQQVKNTAKVYILGNVPGGMPMDILEAPEEDYFLYPVSKPTKEIGALHVVGDSVNNVATNGSYVVVDFSRKDKHELEGKLVIAAAHGECTVKRLCLNPDLLMPDSTDKSHKPIALTEDWQILGVVIGVINMLEEI